MVYIVGFIGFVSGFAFGILILNRLLKNVPAEDLMHNKSIKFRYGLFTWLLAGLGCYSAIWLYKLYFLSS